MKGRSPGVVEMLHFIYSLLNLEGIHHILDIGCGDGYDLWQISQLTLAGPGPIFAYTFEQLQNAQSLDDDDFRIPTLDEVLAKVGGKIGLEIEINKVCRGKANDNPRT